MEIFIVTAARNEEKQIAYVLKGLRRKGYNNIVVVDDGSADDTAAIARKGNAHVLQHVINRGQGAALRTGIDYALLHHADIIVTFDADGQHDPNEIKDMIEPIINGECQVTLGSRFLGKSPNIPWIKKIMLKGGILFTYLVSGIKLTDAHNGFRALSRSAAQMIEIRQDRMEHASEIVEEIHKKQISYKEVPVTIRYTRYSIQHGQSPFASFKIAFNLLVRKLVR